MKKNSSQTTKIIYEVYVGYYGAKPTLATTCATPTEVKAYIKSIDKPYVKTNIVERRVLDYQKINS